MRASMAIAMKDLRSLSRDRLGAFFVFVFPVLFGILFGLIFAGAAGNGGPSEIPVALVDADATDASRAFAELLEGEPAFAVERFDARGPAADAVRTGHAAASIVLAEGFGASLDRVFLGEPVRLEGAIDPSRGFESGVIQGVVTRSVFALVAARMGDAETRRAMLDAARGALRDADGVAPATRGMFEAMFTSVDALAGSLESGGGAGGDGGAFEFAVVELDFDSVAREGGSGPRTMFDITFPQAAAWGLLGCVTGFGLSLVSERTRGTLTRLVMAPVSRRQILMGKAIGCFVSALAVLGLLIGVAAALGVRPDSWALLALAVVCACVGFVGVMMLLAAVGKTEAASEGIARAVLLVLALIGGAGVPLAMMPDWIRAVASVSPFKWAIAAFDGAIWRDYSLAEMATPCAVLLGVGVVGFALGARLFRMDSAA